MLLLYTYIYIIVFNILGAIVQYIVNKIDVRSKKLLYYDICIQFSPYYFIYSFI